MGGGDLNTKKSWHPSTLKNQERVWKAEQVAANEKRRIDDLRREIDLEKSTEDLMMIGQSSGVLKEKSDKLDWMYKRPGETVDREEYLLGKTVDKNFEQQPQSSSYIPKKNHVEHECIPFSIRNFRGDNFSPMEVQVDMARKVMEDPLVAIKKRELESRAELLQNPVKLKELTRLLREDKEMKNRKKEKSKKKKKNYDLDSKLAEKLKMLKGKDDLDIDSLLSIKLKKTKSILKSKIRSKNSSESSDESESEDEEKTVKKRKKSKASKAKKKRKHVSESSDDDKSEVAAKSHKKRKKSKDVPKFKIKSKQGLRNSDTSGSEDVPNSRRKRIKNENISKAKSRMKHSSESSDDSESEDTAKNHSKRRKTKDVSKTKKRLKHISESSNENESEDEAKSHKNIVDKYLYDRRRDNFDYNNRSSNKYSHLEHHNIRHSDDPNRKTSYEKSYHKPTGHGGRDRIRDSRGDLNKDKDKWHRSRTEAEVVDKKRDNEISWKKVDRQKLSNAEREKKLREMVENASNRDRERERKIAQYREQERKQTSRDKMAEFDKSFVEKQLWKTAQAGTVESRIKANINNIQRSNRAMDSNFAKR